MKRSAFFFLYVLMLSCAFAAKVPDWIENPAKVYPQSDYFTSVAVAKDKDEAELNAVEQIASVFGQDVSSESSAESMMREKSVSSLGSSTETEKSLNRKILRSVEQDDLIGIEVADSYFDKKRKEYYAIAVMNKEKAFSLYEKMVRNNNGKAESYLKSAKTDYYSLCSYSCLLTAYNYAKVNERYVQRLQVISLEKGKNVSKSIISTAQITPLLLDVAQNTKISVCIANDDGGKLALAFSEVLSDFGFIVSGDKARYTLEGSVGFLDRPIAGKGIVNCEYTVQCKITDTQNGDGIAPWSVSGREGSKTAEYAHERAVAAIKKKIAADFAQDFKDALGEKYE